MNTLSQIRKKKTSYLPDRNENPEILELVNPLTTNVLHHTETSKFICNANQLTGFYMMGEYWLLMDEVARSNESIDLQKRNEILQKVNDYITKCLNPSKVNFFLNIHETTL